MGRFPDNKRFAFTIMDDTDFSTLENVRPVYRFLAELGFRTTKSVWPMASVPEGHIDGESLQDYEYLQFVLWLQREGFEISLHNVRNHHAPRRLTEQGFEEFRRRLGQYPRIHCNHSRNQDCIYWGAQRFRSAAMRFGYSLATRFFWDNYFHGDRKDHPYFWGDLCHQHIAFVRNFVFDEINLDRINPTMPYHDPSKPYVNLWFSACDGANVERFCAMLSDANQDRLEAEGGVCIIYTHFALGFFQVGKLYAEFVRLMQRLATMNGWFVPVGTLLDHLGTSRDHHDISPTELTRMERSSFWSMLRRGFASPYQGNITR